MASDGTALVDQLVDWDLAARAASRAPAGPPVTRKQAEEVVADLRRFATEAVDHIAEVSDLRADGPVDVRVVDRAGWARANTRSFRDLLAPAVTSAVQRRGRFPTAGFTTISSRMTGIEVGSLLGFLSSKVLGQYDPFAGTPGRLMLLAPNIVQSERELGVVPRDFRLWVCLHEETHRAQFTANPWLAEYLREEIRALAAEVLADPGQLLDRILEVIRRFPELLREGSTVTVSDLLRNPVQQERLSRITAVMTLLEGHADVMMDEVGPKVIPTVSVIRERFAQRRQGRGAVDKAVRRLLGLEAKARQYSEGATFVRAVRAQVGLDGFNAVWSGPDRLPGPEDIADPSAWVARVHG
jgi:coenzyme F420 biosynthesis associated uncharacterized protein